ncbi:MAG: hypothetical protein ACMG6E_04535 [Candidatus Roizmanbacteria bacterium]
MKQSCQDLYDLCKECVGQKVGEVLGRITMLAENIVEPLNWAPSDDDIYLICNKYVIDIAQQGDANTSLSFHKIVSLRPLGQDHLWTDSDGLARTLKKYGIAIIPRVIDEEEQQAMKDGAWNFLTSVTANFETPMTKDDPSTWNQFWELYPLHGMLLQHHGVGHAQYLWNLRQNPKIVAIFSKLWNCPAEDLLVSFDGISFALPHEVTKRGHYRGNEWFHCDQRLGNDTFVSAQSWVTAEEVREGDATLTVIEGSHLLREKMMQEFEVDGAAKQKDWFKYDADQVQWFKEQGCVVRDIICPAGSMVF